MNELIIIFNMSFLYLYYREMSAYRITVEWGIGRVKTLWKAVTNKVVF